MGRQFNPDSWLHFQTAGAAMEVAWQQMQLVVKTPKSEGGAPRYPEIGDSQSSPLRKFDDAANDSVQIEGTNFAAMFSRLAGALTSLVYDGREMLASDKKVAQASRLPNVSGQSANSIYPAAGETPALLSGPVLQVSIRPGREQLRAGCAGTLRGFTNENASFAPAASPVSGARRSGQVIIANSRKNSANLWQGT